ncbi:hypothetical protein [Chondromyces crocatus]|uniref:hypothetical protein n=1 Tax=Chondromyces crocatus TaxID=52 RepID=UPI0012E318B7|nr:hypothetical protein [Chondromyces crocatus]
MEGRGPVALAGLPASAWRSRSRASHLGLGGRGKLARKLEVTNVERESTNVERESTNVERESTNVERESTNVERESTNVERESTIGEWGKDEP